MSSCCTLRLKRRRAFSNDSPSCSLTSAKLTHPQTRPDGPNSYYRDLTPSQGVGSRISWGISIKTSFLWVDSDLMDGSEGNGRKNRNTTVRSPGREQCQES